MSSTSDLVPSKLAELPAHGGQVVAPREVVDIRAQSRPVALRLSAIIALNHHLIARRASACALRVLPGAQYQPRWESLLGPRDAKN